MNKAPVHLAVGWTVGNSQAAVQITFNSPGSDKLNEVQLYISTSCQPRQPGNPSLL